MTKDIPSMGDAIPEDTFSCIPEGVISTKTTNKDLSNMGTVILHEVKARYSKGDDDKEKFYFMCAYSDEAQKEFFIAGTGTAQTARLIKGGGVEPSESISLDTVTDAVNKILPLKTKVTKPEGKLYYLFE